MGYYWPSIFRDARKYIQGYDSFQWMGQPSWLDEMPLQPQLVLNVENTWGGGESIFFF